MITNEENDIDDANVNMSIASLRAVQELALEALRRIVARVEASQACGISHDGESLNSLPLAVTSAPTPSVTRS